MVAQSCGYFVTIKWLAPLQVVGVVVNPLQVLIAEEPIMYWQAMI